MLLKFRQKMKLKNYGGANTKQTSKIQNPNNSEEAVSENPIDLNLVKAKNLVSLQLAHSENPVTLYSERPSELYSEDLVKAEASLHCSPQPL